jgi:hypothetical protein
MATIRSTPNDQNPLDIPQISQQMTGMVTNRVSTPPVMQDLSAIESPITAVDKNGNSFTISRFAMENMIVASRTARRCQFLHVLVANSGFGGLQIVVEGETCYCDYCSHQKFIRTVSK